MKLPVIIPQIENQSWECRGCTTCCRELVVHLSAADRTRIDEQQWASKLGVAPYVRHSSGIVLNHAPEGGCVFLLADGRCRIHADFGIDAKPLACRLYPFTLEREGDAIRAGLRFDCPTVTRSDGRTMAGHRKELQLNANALAKELPGLLRDDRSDVAFSRDLTIDRATLDRILLRLDRWIGDDGRPVNQRIAGLHSITSTLNQAKLERFDNSRLAELVDMLADDLPTRVAELDDSSPAPTPRQMKLLRQSAYAHTGYARFGESQLGFWQSLRFRFGQLKVARAMMRGEGPIPALSSDDAVATFAQVGEVRPLEADQTNDVADLLTRYLQARITNHDGFGPAYYGWSILAGLNATLLAIAVAGWFARRSAAAAGRTTLAPEDAQRGVAIVDRTAGRSPELGARSAKLRLSYLSQDDGLLRLIRRFAFVGDGDGD